MTCKESFESHIRSLDGDYNLMMVGDVYIDVETQIEWRTWQKAWQAALASQQPADDVWIEWKGGECPVVDGDIIHVKLRGGAQSGFSVCKPLSMQWAHEDNGWDIIAYRVVKP